MVRINLHKIITFFLIIMISIVLSGCPDSNQQQPQGQQQSKKEEKKPDKLKKIEDSVESMIGMLGGVPTESEGGKQQGQQGGGQQQGQQAGGQQGGGQQGQQSGGQGQSGKQGQGGQQGKQESEKKPMLETKPDVNWEEAFKNIEDIHKQWNDYIAQAAKDGVSKSNIDGFSNALDDLTGYIGTKDREPAILAANSLTLFIANFWSSYDGKIPPDLKRLKHYIRNVIYYSYMPDWNKTQQNLNIGKSLFQSIRMVADKEKQDLINKLDYSIQELDRVVKRKNPSLIKIKGMLAVNNIVELEKQMESSK